MKKILWIALASLAACATTEKFEANLNQYVGHSESDLVSQWGPPASSYPLNDGSKVLQYQKTGHAVLPGYATATTQQIGNQSFTQVNGMPAMMIARHCTVNWTIDSSGTVTRWSYEGNACKAK